jgi:hypothetical protein
VNKVDKNFRATKELHMPPIIHTPLTVACAECGNRRIQTAVAIDASDPDYGYWLIITTCVFCDAPDADQPFAD